MASCGGHNAPGRRPVWRRRPAAANERMRDTNSATQTLPGVLNDRPPHSARRRARLGARRRTETRRPLQAAGRRRGLRALCASGPDGPAAFTCLVLGQEVCGTQGTTSPLQRVATARASGARSSPPSPRRRRRPRLCAPLIIIHDFQPMAHPRHLLGSC
jgi:hypothetical protein